MATAGSNSIKSLTHPSVPALNREHVVLPADSPLIGSCVLLTSLAVLEELDRISVVQPGPIELKHSIEKCRDALASHFTGLGDFKKRAGVIKAELRRLIDKPDYTHLSQSGASHG